MYSLSNPITKLLLTGALSLFSTASILSCGSDHKPTEPGTSATADLSELEGDGVSLGAGAHPGHRGFFPLAIGNTWTYNAFRTERIEDDAFISLSTHTQRRELVGTEMLFGRGYVIEEWKSWSPLWAVVGSDDDTVRNWVRYRQDRAGFYEADVSLSQPPGAMGDRAAEFDAAPATEGEMFSSRLRNAGRPLTAAQAASYDAGMAKLQEKMEVVRAALSWHGHHSPRRFDRRRGGVLDNEITRLKYPLRLGQHWTLREFPLFTSRVVGYDLLRLPAGRLPGVRIMIESDVFGPKDKVLVWYSRVGLLRMSAHLEMPHTTYEDPYGELATLVIEEQMTLESFDLVDR